MKREQPLALETRLARRLGGALWALVVVLVVPSATPLVSAMKMPPVPVLDIRAVAAVSMSSVPPVAPIPEAALNVTVVPAMFSLPDPSAAVTSLIAPPVAVTLT